MKNRRGPIRRRVNKKCKGLKRMRRKKSSSRKYFRRGQSRGQKVKQKYKRNEY